MRSRSFQWRLVGFVFTSILITASFCEAGIFEKDYERPVIGVMYGMGPMWNKIGGANTPFDISFWYAYEGFKPISGDFTLTGGSTLNNYEIYILLFKQHLLLGIGRYDRSPRKYRASSKPISFPTGTRTYDAWTAQEDKWTTIRLGYYYHFFTSDKLGKLSAGLLVLYCMGGDAVVTMQSSQTDSKYGSGLFPRNNKFVFKNPSVWIGQIDIRYDFSFAPAAVGVRLDFGLFGNAYEKKWQWWNSDNNTFLDETTYNGGMHLIDVSSSGYGFIPYVTMYLPLSF